MCVVAHEDEKLLEFEIEAECDTAVAILNTGCESCETDCGQYGSIWTEKHAATNGKFYCFKHPDRMVGIEGVLTYTEKASSSVDI